MAFTGRSSGVLYSATEGDSTTGTLYPFQVVFTGSTGGPSGQCKLTDRLTGGVVFDQLLAASYATVALEMPPLKHWDGVIVTTLDEGYVQIYLR